VGCSQNGTKRISFLTYSLQPTAYSLVHVVAGALFDSAGRVLVAQRPAGKHMAGGWEFPGGKREPGEEPRETLVRELRVELGIEVHEAAPLIVYEHEYPHRRVLLELWVVTRYGGEPQPLDAPALQWVAIDDLERIGLLEADRPMIPALLRFRSDLSG
jgi:8-oxo-dGTP diphosphatase